jgi:hypothetical protein
MSPFSGWRLPDHGGMIYASNAILSSLSSKVTAGSAVRCILSARSRQRHVLRRAVPGRGTFPNLRASSSWLSSGYMLAHASRHAAFTADGWRYLPADQHALCRCERSQHAIRGRNGAVRGCGNKHRSKPRWSAAHSFWQTTMPGGQIAAVDLSGSESLSEIKQGTSEDLRGP